MKIWEILHLDYTIFKEDIQVEDCNIMTLLETLAQEIRLQKFKIEQLEAENEYLKRKDSKGGTA